MKLLSTIRNAASRVIDTARNAIDRDQALPGIQLVQGGFQGGVNRVKQAVQTNPDQFNLYKQMGGGNFTGSKPVDVVAQVVGKPIDIAATFAKQAGQSFARSVPGLLQTGTKAAAPLFGVDRAYIPDEVKVSELFPGNKTGQTVANTLFGKDETIRTIGGTKDLLQKDYGVPAPLALGLAVADPISNLIPGSSAAKSGGKELLKEGAEQLLKEGGETIVKEVVEKGGKKLFQEGEEALAEQSLKNISNVAGNKGVKQALENAVPQVKQGIENATKNINLVDARSKDALDYLPEYKNELEQLSQPIKRDPQVIKEYENYKNSDYFNNKDNLISTLNSLENAKETPTYKALDQLRQERGFGDVVSELSGVTKRTELKNIKKATEAKTQKANLDGFTQNKSAMRSGKIQSLLDKPIRFEGRVMPKRDYIRKLIADGYEVDSTQNRLYQPGRRDVFQEVSKTEADYARYLSNQATQIAQGAKVDTGTPLPTPNTIEVPKVPQSEVDVLLTASNSKKVVPEGLSLPSGEQFQLPQPNSANFSQAKSLLKNGYTLEGITTIVVKNTDEARRATQLGIPANKLKIGNAIDDIFEPGPTLYGSKQGDVLTKLPKNQTAFDFAQDAKNTSLNVGNRVTNSTRKLFLDTKDNLKKTFGSLYDTHLAPVMETFTQRMGDGARWSQDYYKRIDALGIKPGSKDDKLIRLFQGKDGFNKVVSQVGREKALQLQNTFTALRQTYDEIIDFVNTRRKAAGLRLIPKKDNFLSQISSKGRSIFDATLEGNTQTTEAISEAIFKKQDAKATTGAVESLRDYINFAQKAGFTDLSAKDIKDFRLALSQNKDTPEQALQQLKKIENNILGVKEKQPFLEGVTKVVDILSVGKVLGKASTLLNQALAIPQGAAATGINFFKGIGSKEANQALKQSNFIAAIKNRPPRSLRSGGIYNKYKGILGDVLAGGQDFSNSLIFKGFFEQARAASKSFDEAVKIADDLTPKIVGDRRLGMSPEVYNTYFGNIFGRFTIEPTAAVTRLANSIGKGRAKEVIGTLIAWHLFNDVLEDKVYGYRPFPIDPVEWVNNFMENYQGSETKEKSAIKAYAGLFADALSSVPIASNVFNSVYSGGETLGLLPDSRKVFGSSDQTWMNVGGLLNPFQNFDRPITENKIADAGLNVTANVVPGVEQLLDTTQAAQSLDRGYAKTKAGAPMYQAPTTLPEIAKSFAFGQSSTQNAQDWFNNDFAPWLTDTQKKALDRLPESQQLSYLQNTQSKNEQVNKLKYAQEQVSGGKTPSSLGKKQTKIGNLNVSTRESDGFPFPDFSKSAPGQTLRADLNFEGIGDGDIVFNIKTPNGKVMSFPQTKESFPGGKQEYGLEMQIPKDSGVGTAEVWVTVNGKDVADTRKKHEIIATEPVNRYMNYDSSGEPIEEVLRSGKTFEQELPYQENQSLDSLFTKPTSKVEEDENKTLFTEMLAGGVPISDKDTQLVLFKGKTADSQNISDRKEVFSTLSSLMADEYLGEQQKQAILNASGANENQVEFYTFASKTNDEKLQELLPSLGDLSTPENFKSLLIMRAKIAGKQGLAPEMIDYLYENDFIGKDQKELLKAVEFDEINQKFFIKKSSKYGSEGSGGSGDSKKLTYSQLLKLFSIDLKALNSSPTKSADNYVVFKDPGLIENILRSRVGR